MKYFALAAKCEKNKSLIRRSVFHSVSYFIMRSVISQIPKGIYFIEKDLVNRQGLFLVRMTGVEPT